MKKAAINNTASPYSVTAMLDVMVAMRDGPRLATDIYLPSAETLSFPVLLERTPYDKSGISRSEKTARQLEPITRSELARRFASRGFVVVMQDCRGRYSSEGTFKKYVNEAEDGFDTMQWIVKQPWCNGKVGTMGLSYGAHTQTALAGLNPPGLAAMFIDSGGFSSAFHSGIRQGGAFELKQITWAHRHALLSNETANDPQRRAQLEQVDLAAWFAEYPWREGHSPLSAAPEYEAYIFEQWQDAVFSEHWKKPALYAQGHYDNFPDVPIAIMGSWYDPYVKSCIAHFTGLRKNNSQDVHLIMGPWTHGQRSVSYSGDIDFGDASILDDYLKRDYFELRCEWFEKHLKSVPQEENSVFTQPIHYFQMGGGSGNRNQQHRLNHGGQWQTDSLWPPPSSRSTEYYFNSSGNLTLSAALTPKASMSYRYNPAKPTPTIGGAIASGDPIMTAGGYDQREQMGFFGCDNIGRSLAERTDVLSFKTDTLLNDINVSGSVIAKLWVSSNCPDTDFTVKLIDQYPPSEDYPEGYALNISDGIFRMRYRQGWEQEVFMQPDQIYEIEVELFDLSNLFVKGHCIRVDISSSNYPLFDRNPNTGEPQGKAQQLRIAQNRLHMDNRYRSYISLATTV